ncbi:MAG TPA: zf-HC2 domain-containing protein [Polyangiaceae bacterium]|jgi:anti-sigma factor RsiW|nr:zf-HC2 domain-containing protein [Polyangiaceae bacterium]
MSATLRELVCKEVVELVNEYLSHRLDEQARRAFDAHLETCPPCTTYLEQMKAVLNVAGSLGSAPVAEDVEQELLALFGSWRDKNVP